MMVGEPSDEKRERSIARPSRVSSGDRPSSGREEKRAPVDRIDPLGDAFAGGDGGGVEAAAAREDTAARVRDELALARDQVAALRDREMAARDAAWDRDVRVVSGAEIIRRAAGDRKRAAEDRAAAADDRAQGAAYRERAGRDREQAARDRREAQADRRALLYQLAIAETDALTGARSRAAGLAALDCEIDRANRAKCPLVVAYIDVVGLRAVIDAHGRAAGDGLLQRAVHAIRGHLRSYDIIARLGDTVFLCVMPDATIDSARRRLEAVQTALTVDPYRYELTTGFAALAPQDTVSELIRRADAEMRVEI